MLNAELKNVNHDVKALVSDAQALFAAAAELTGEKADEFRARGIGMIDTALAMSQGLQVSAYESGKEISAAADSYFRKHPWVAVTGAAGIGLMIGVLIARK